MRNVVIEDLVYLVGQRVRIAFHLHKKCFSIRDESSMRVVGYAKEIVLRDVTFLVSQSGRTRVLREKKKNVHAYVAGIYVHASNQNEELGIHIGEAYYNPYRTSSFVDRATFEPLSHAPMAWCKDGKVYYS